MSKKLKTATAAVKAAEKALKVAEEAARKARIEVLSRTAEEAIQAADRAVWEVVRESDGWEGPLGKVYAQFDPLRDAFADCVFGSRERLVALNKLDPDRWALEGEYKAHSHGYTTDEDMSYSIATWLFDCDVDKNAQDQRYQKLRKQAVEAVGEAVAHQGFKFYLEGRHDT